MENACDGLNRLWNGFTMDDPDAFTRLDENSDEEFYSQDRFVHHLDKEARKTVEEIIGRLVVEEQSVVLDLMAGWDSHLPPDMKPARVVGLGMNENELIANPDLTEKLVHDLNREPSLPFPDNTFDIVLNTVSVDYMTRPVEVFREVSRILKPGGLFLVVFSNRMFVSKAVKVWRDSTEDERVVLVEAMFNEAGGFETPSRFVSRNRPRPRDDKYAWTGLPSDPVYVMYAEKPGKPEDRKVRPSLEDEAFCRLPAEELARRTALIKETLACPHCGEKLKKWQVPDNPFCQTWDNEYMYICFNDACPYYMRSRDVMAKQTCGAVSMYRLMYNPDKECCLAIPVPSPFALKEGIMED